jgi:O-antigen ligase
MGALVTEPIRVQVLREKPIEMHSRWFSASGGMLLSTLIAAPLAFGAVQPWAWASLCIASGIAFASWAAGCAATGQIRIARSLMYALVLGALLFVTLQFVLGKTISPVSTREALVKFAGYAAIFFLTGQIAIGLTARQWRALGCVLIAYVFAMAVFAISQFFSNTELIYWMMRPKWGGEIFGPYVNHNHYAGLMEIVLPLALASVLALPERHGLKVLGWFSVVLGLASVLLCGSRGGTLAVCVEFAVFFLVLLVRPYAGISRMTALAALAVIMIAPILFWWLDPGSVLKRWEATATAPQTAIEHRVNMTTDSMRILRENPMFGVGAGAFEEAYPHFQSWVADGVVEHAHNDYAELLAETGMTGGLLLAIAGCLGLHRAIANLACQNALPSGLVQLGAAVACCGLLVHSFSDFNLHIPANAAWFSAAVGLVAVSFSGTSN